MIRRRAPHHTSRAARAAALLLALGVPVALGCTALFGIDGDYVEGTTGGTTTTTTTTTTSSSGGAAGSGGACNGAACDGPSEACCDGACVRLDNDEKNCGMCGGACPGTVCLGGECTTTCVLPFENCDQNIALNGCEADLTSDPNNCGACGFGCPAGAACAGSQCACPAGHVDCDGFPENGCEADLMTDPTRCGACNQACAPGQDCAFGLCTCAAGLGDCNKDARDGCESPLETIETCGACDTACGENQVCAGAKCACAPGFLDCDAVAGCEASASSVTSCGACGVTCDPMMVCNGVACAAGCDAGQTLCGASCVDTTADPLNCGGCGVAVGPHQTCAQGTPKCAANYADCTAAPGCETPTSGDASNCGACGVACKPGAVCVQGGCVCSVSTPNDCGADCRLCCGPNDCGDGDGCTMDTCAPDGLSCSHAACPAGTKCCGQLACAACCSDADCGAGETCSGGVCSMGCPGGKTLCNGQCVDLMSDPNNCNGCGIRCGSDGTCGCSSGMCTGGTVYFSDDFSNNANGWTLGTQWEIAPAQASMGQQAGFPDPATDHSSTADNGVAGIVVGGNQTTGASNTYLVSPTIDTSAASTLTLTFWRWLNNPAGSDVRVECWAGKNPWKPLWQSNALITDSQWTRFDYPATLCKSAATRVRFRLDNSQVGSIMSSWNIDDVTLSSAACQ